MISLQPRSRDGLTPSEVRITEGMSARERRGVGAPSFYTRALAQTGRALHFALQMVGSIPIARLVKGVLEMFKVLLAITAIAVVAAVVVIYFIASNSTT